MAGLAGTLLFILFVGLHIRSLHAFVSTEPEVTGWKEGAVRLKCEFSEKPYAVYWGKIHESFTDDEPLARFFNENTTSFDERFSMDKDFSLVIQDVQVSDEGRYSCEVVTEDTVDSKNFTRLVVNALASKPSVEQCDYETTSGSNVKKPMYCTLPTSSDSLQFNLECKVSGFRPNISLDWKANGRILSPSGPPSQRELPDGTWERVVTIGVIAKKAEDQNFTCVASGTAVNGTEYAYATVLAMAGPSEPEEQSSTGSKVGIAFACIIVITLVVLGLLILLGVILRDRGKLPKRGEAALNLIPCLRKPYSVPEEQSVEDVEDGNAEDKLSPEEIKLNELNEERDELRKRIRDYQPQNAAGAEDKGISKVNIGLFGQMGAGKSTFINSLHYALTGVYDKLAEEGNIESSGAKTVKREHYPITSCIDLIDTRGMPSFADSFLKDIDEQIRGKRGIDPEKAISPKREEEIHCSVFVYHYKPFGKDQALGFINKLFSQLFKYYGRSPMFVVTHKAEIKNDVEMLTRMFTSLNIPEENIWFFENDYSTRSQVKDCVDDQEKNVEDLKKKAEDLEKDIELLQFLEKAFSMCGRNIRVIEAEKKEKRERKPFGWLFG